MMGPTPMRRRECLDTAPGKENQHNITRPAGGDTPGLQTMVRASPTSTTPYGMSTSSMDQTATTYGRIARRNGPTQRPNGAPIQFVPPSMRLDAGCKQHKLRQLREKGPSNLCQFAERLQASAKRSVITGPQQIGGILALRWYQGWSTRSTHLCIVRRWQNLKSQN